MTAPKQRATLQLMVEPLDSSLENRTSVVVNQCAEVSRMVAAILDVEDPINEAYNLEVSSTGLQRPLVIEKDFIDYHGAKVKIELNQSVEKQKRFTGIIRGFADLNLILEEIETEKRFTIPFASMKKANLYYTQKEINELFN